MPDLNAHHSAAEDHRPPRRAGRISPSRRHFVRHYVEMVIAMFLGMVVLGLPIEGALRAMGTSASDLESSAPAVALLGMAVIMTVPMVGWMRYRGHTWRPCIEMSAAMFIPTFAVIALLAAGAGDFHSLMVWEHAAMLPSMLVAMLLRPHEYTGHDAHGHHGHAEQVAG